MDKIEIYPLDVIITGVTRAGKSTTLNAFFQKTVAKVGDGVDPETMELDSYMLDEQAYSIQKRVREARGVSIMKLVYYSAEYGWNVQKIFDFIIDNISKPYCNVENITRK